MPSQLTHVHNIQHAPLHRYAAANANNSVHAQVCLLLAAGRSQEKFQEFITAVGRAGSFACSTDSSCWFAKAGLHARTMI